MVKQRTFLDVFNQAKDLAGDCVKFLLGLFITLSWEDLRILVVKKQELFNALKKGVISVLAKNALEFAELRLEWQKFYSDVMGMTMDFSKLVIPPKPDGDWWLIAVAPGITYNQIATKLGTLFRVRIYGDKLINGLKEQRKATIDAPYAIWVRAATEADPDNANRSADDLADTDQITLMERLLLEGVYFQRTGKHLDINKTTLCAGSRALVGSVPRVYWDSGGDELSVGWCSVDNRGVDLRSRSASC